MSTSTDQVVRIALPGGGQMPQLGFGVFQVPPRETAEAVARALAAGYRHIDTAAAYGNEAQVAQAIRAQRPGPRRGVRRRPSASTTTTATSRPSARSREPRAARLRLRRPVPDPLAGTGPRPLRRDLAGVHRAARRGPGPAIGVSNFQPEHLRRVIAETGETPAVNQIELHPYLQQRALRREHEELGIVTEAWSPLAQGAGARGPDDREHRAGATPSTPGPGGHPLASAAGQRGDPQVGHAGAHRGELRRVRLRVGRA